MALKITVSPDRLRRAQIRLSRADLNALRLRAQALAARGTEGSIATPIIAAAALLSGSALGLHLAAWEPAPPTDAGVYIEFNAAQRPTVPRPIEATPADTVPEPIPRPEPLVEAPPPPETHVPEVPPPEPDATLDDLELPPIEMLDTPALAVQVISEETATSNYWSQVNSRIAEQVRYPARSRMLGHEGTVTVDLHIGASGEVIRISARGSERFTDAVVRAIHGAAPFPAPPADLKPPVPLRVPIAFELR